MPFGGMGARFGRMGGLGGGPVVDTTAPTLSLPLSLPLGDTSGYLSVTTDTAEGTLYYVVTTSATPPSAAQVKAGQNNGGTAAVYAGNQAISSTGAKTGTATGLSSATAYYAYFMHEDAAANQSSVSASATFSTLTTGTSDSSFDTLVAAMTTPPADLRKGYIARLIGALYAGSVWAKMDVLWVLAAADSQAGYLNWKSPGTFTLVENGTGTFTADRGYTGNGTTGFLATGWDPATNGVQYTRDGAHLGTYTGSANNGSAVAEFGSETGGPAYTSIKSQTGTSGSARINGSAGPSATPSAGGTAPIHFMGVRRTSVDVDVWRDGVVVGTQGAATSAALTTTDLAIGKTAGNFSTRQCAANHAGTALSTQEGLDLYTALNAYMVAVGADT